MFFGPKEYINVQFKTVSRLRSHYFNFVHHSNNDGPGLTTLNRGTNLEWLKKLIRGCHKRMEDIRLSYCSFTIHKRFSAKQYYRRID